MVPDQHRTIPEVSRALARKELALLGGQRRR
jgi:hypothetical protein